MCVVLALVPAALAAGVTAASASVADGVAASSMPFPIGPVGIAAVVVGLGGLVTGLVRHRRREVAAPVLEANRPPQARQPEPAAGEHAA